MEPIEIILADDHEIFRKGLEVTISRIPLYKSSHSCCIRERGGGEVRS
jgi:DNA-binding NarL/FixJ family response regulator